jgi:hypothetical protein
LASGQPGEIEGRLRRFDSMYHWFLFRATPSIRWNPSLEALRRVVEQTTNGCLCSVLVFDPTSSKIQQAVAPGLPSSYNDRFAGIPVDREGGPCTEAARRKTQVIRVSCHSLGVPADVGAGACNLAIRFETQESLSERYVQQNPYLTERVPATIERTKVH